MFSMFMQWFVLYLLSIVQGLLSNTRREISTEWEFGYLAVTWVRCWLAKLRYPQWRRTKNQLTSSWEFTTENSDANTKLAPPPKKWWFLCINLLVVLLGIFQHEMTWELIRKASNGIALGKGSTSGSVLALILRGLKACVRHVCYFHESLCCFWHLLQFAWSLWWVAGY